MMGLGGMLDTISGPYPTIRGLATKGVPGAMTEFFGARKSFTQVPQPKPSGGYSTGGYSTGSYGSGGYSTGSYP